MTARTRWAVRTAFERADAPVDLPPLRSLWLDGMHVRVAGTGTPVVLVHGVLVSGRYLSPLAVRLARRHRVLVPDLPGYGLSADGPGRLAALADAAMAVSDAPVALVGNSFGAQVVVEAAVRRPDRVSRVALLGPSVDPAARTLLGQYVRWQRSAIYEHPSVWPLMARDVVDVGLPRALRMLRVMLDDAIECKLPDVRCPSLVVRGDRDRVVPQQWAERATRLLPDGRLVVIPGGAHMAHYSISGPVASALLEFLS